MEFLKTYGKVSRSENDHLVEVNLTGPVPEKLKDSLKEQFKIRCVTGSFASALDNLSAVFDDDDDGDDDDGDDDDDNDNYKSNSNNDDNDDNDDDDDNVDNDKHDDDDDEQDGNEPGHDR